MPILFLCVSHRFTCTAYGKVGLYQFFSSWEPLEYLSTFYTSSKSICTFFSNKFMDLCCNEYAFFMDF